MSDTPHMLDLPALHTHPSADVLLAALNALAIKPPTFDASSKGNGRTHYRRTDDGLPRYLTSIISSGLAWIRDESRRETVWEAASARLSERSGRTAMPSVHRTFQVPIGQDRSTAIVSIVVREPSLTGDNLGHKTWAASYLLAKRLSLMRPLLPAFATSRVQSLRHSSTQPEEGHAELPHVLELGAGTGLVGLAAAASFATHVDLTDLPEIYENLLYNCQQNETMICERGGSTSAFVLDWSGLPSEQSLSTHDKYSLVLAADSLYSPEHPAMLCNAISRFLKAEAGSRAIVELPLRDAYQPEFNEFRRLMDGRGLILVSQGEETGFDDWEDGSQEVKCWWGVWGWCSV